MAHEGARSQSTGVWSTNMPKDKAAWDRHREIIYQLYILEDLTLKGVKCALETQYGFPQYRLRDYEIVLRDYFGFRKNLRSQDWQAIAIHREKRLQCGEQSDVYLYGSLLEKARVDRAVRRSRNKWKLPHRALTAPPLPEGITIRKPVPVSSCGISAQQSHDKSSIEIPRCHSVGQIMLEGRPRLDLASTIANIGWQKPWELSVYEIRLHLPFTQFIETTIMAIYKLAVPTPNSYSSADPIVTRLPQIIKALGYSPHIHISEQTSTLTGTLRATIECHLNSREALRSMKSINGRFSFERIMYLFSMMSNKKPIDTDDVLNLLDWVEFTEVDVLKPFFALPLPTMAASWEFLMATNAILTRAPAFIKLVDVALTIRKGQWLRARAGDALGVAIWLKLTALMRNLLSYGLSPNDEITRNYQHKHQSGDGRVYGIFFPEKVLEVAIMCTDVEAVKALLENGAQVDQHIILRFLNPLILDSPGNLERMYQCLRLLLKAGASVDVRMHQKHEQMSSLEELGWSIPSAPSWFTDRIWQNSHLHLYCSKAFDIVARYSKRMRTTVTMGGACHAASLGPVQLQHYLRTRGDTSSINGVIILEIALSEAVSRGDLIACESLLQYGVDPNAIHFLTALHEESGVPSTHEPDPNYLWVPLHWNIEEFAPVFRAARRADIPLLKLLFEAGADFNRYNLLSSLYFGEFYEGDWTEASTSRHTHSQWQNIDYTNSTTETGLNKVEKVFDFLIKAGFDVQVYGGEAMAQSVMKLVEKGGSLEIVLLQCDWLNSKGAGWDFEIQGRNLIHLIIRFSWFVEILPAIKFLLGRGVEVHSNPCDTGYTMLHDAVRQRPSLEVIEFLLNQGADVSRCSQRDQTVLQSVFEYRPRLDIDGAICKRLLDAGAPLIPKHHLPGDGTRVHCLGNLMMLPEVEDTSILSLLETIMDAPLCYDADYLRAEDLATAGDFYLCCSRGDRFHEFSPWRLAQKISPLQAAIRSCRFNIAKDLLHRGANEQHIISPFVTGLQVAVKVCAQHPMDHSAIAFMSFLLGSGAEVDVRAGNGLNALHRAAAEGSLNIATLLLENGADPNILTEIPYFQRFHSEIFGKVFGKKRNGSMTTLQVFYRRASIVESGFAEIYGYGRDGTRWIMQPCIPCVEVLGPVWPLRPLDLAAITGRLDMVQLLLNAGGVSGYPRVGPYDGAIDCAVDNEHHAVACLLREASIGVTTRGASFEMNPACREASGLSLRQ